MNAVGQEVVDGQCERTLITFTNRQHFRRVFAPYRNPPAAVEKKICPVTKLPAKYMDPLTKTPYRDAAAFRKIREVYYRKYDGVLR